MSELIDSMMGDTVASDVDEVTLVDFDPEAENKLVAAACYAYSHLPESQIRMRVEKMSTAEKTEILNTYRNTLDLEVRDESSVVSTGLFYMEKQLEEFIIENWNESEFGKTLDLIYEDGLLKSQQYKTDIGIIDILAKDKATGSYVVIELKRNQTSDDTVGQVLRYMGWVTQNLKEKSVRGIIVAGKYDEKLYYAQNMIQAVDVFLYEVQFKLKEYKK
jgi:hypothetical protein